ncbi:MAG: patatin-like phospholipase family protein [Actinomycetota bacterium]
MTVVHGAAGGPAGPRRSLLLAGGGMRVAYQAGVIRALFEEGLTFAHADGTSGGIMNLGMLLSGLSPDEICERWRTLDVKGFSSLLLLKEYLKLPSAMAMADADGIRGKVFPHLGIDPDRIRAAEGIQGTFNVCNYTTKVNEAIPHQQIDEDYLVASITLPVIMPPVVIGGALYVDSVWIKDTNVYEAVRRGAEEIWLVWCIGNHAEYRPGILEQYVHMIEMSANGVLNEELRWLNEVNERILAGDPVGGREKPIRLHVIRPEFPLPLDPDYFLGRIDGKTLVGMGYRDAKRYLAERVPDGLPPGPGTTRMKIPPPGIAFRETMSGPFTLGSTDPREAGEGVPLSLHAAIAIHDLDRFIADRDHSGSLAGHIEYGPFGGYLPAKAGVFNLFSPAEDSRVKLMVYGVGFEHDGRDYYLAGRKELNNDPGFDLWKDTTTLYATLHEGSSVRGPVVGAGTLRLDMGQFLKMLPTVRATFAGTAGERARLVARFGEFFLGSLWKQYSPG